MKFRLVVGGNTFEFESSSIPLSDIAPILRDWLAVVDGRDDTTIDDAPLRQLTAQLSRSTTALRAALQDAAQPSNHRENAHMAAADVLKELDQAVTEATTVQSSAATLIRGISGRIGDAVKAAIANGATAEQLAPVQAEVDALQASSADLAAAISENTPAA